MTAPASKSSGERENLDVLDVWSRYSDARNAGQHGFLEPALTLLRERASRVARLHTVNDWRDYRQEIRQTWADLVGPFPERTPLNPRVLGAVDKGDFRIEKLVYESRPGFLVTAALFLPARLQGRAPAILYCAGHGLPGFRMRSYQTMIQNLVRKGFIVLAFDPIGQGERLQYIEAKRAGPEIGDFSPWEHSLAGAPAFVAGGSLARHMIWDGIRSIDYLVSRPEVDPERLGITGRSGGGTQTAYIAACDDRIKAAAPECYITNFKFLLQTRGPQDAEQNLYGGISRGFDQPDLLLARAPKPLLIIATTRDIFSIEGTRETFAEVRRAYRALGREDDVAITEDDAGHVSTRKNREACYAFFQRHLGLPGDPADLEVDLLSAGELRITSTGQVATSGGSRTVMDFTREAAEEREAGLVNRRSRTCHAVRVREAAFRLSGYESPPERPESVHAGRYPRDGYAIDKYLLPVNDRYAVPVLVAAPSEPVPEGMGGVIYLHPEGKAVEAGVGGEIERLVRTGRLVIAPDLSQIGELAPPGESPPSAVDLHATYKRWYGYLLLGRSLLGVQVADLVRTVRFAVDRLKIDRRDLVGVARGALGSVLLHAAVVEDLFSRIAVIGTLASWRLLLSNPLYQPHHLLAAVPHALLEYDLPDLAACLAPRPLLAAGLTDGAGALADAAALERDFDAVKAAYAQAGATENLRIEPAGTKADWGSPLIAWLH